MTRARWTALALTLMTSLLVTSGPGLASPYSLEAFGGIYQPESTPKDGEVFGLRFASIPEDWGTMLSLGLIDLADGFFSVEGRDDLEFTLILLDISVVYVFADTGFHIFGGPGYADVDLTVNRGPGRDDVHVNDGMFTLHAGLGYRWTFDSGLFLRPEARARWFDDQDFGIDSRTTYDGVDLEGSIAIGWRF